mgnify:CR=1 FL=1
MESCATSQYWGRQFKAHGHDIKLIPPQFTVPYRRAQKNDFNDAAAIAEAASRPGMKTVPLRSQGQTDIQCLHRARELVVEDCVRLGNQIRALLLENGYAIPQGRATLAKVIPSCLDADQPTLSPRLRDLIQRLFGRWQELEKERRQFDKEIAALADSQPLCQRLMTIPGIGPLIATALFAAVGNASQFKSARNLAAWIGLVPRQYSTGGKTRLLGLSKHGNAYLRKLLVHGARAVVRTAPGRNDPLRQFADRLARRSHVNIVCATANKIARIAWALLQQDQVYRTTGVSPIA